MNDDSVDELFVWKLCGVINECGCMCVLSM